MFLKIVQSVYEGDITEGFKTNPVKSWVFECYTVEWEKKNGTASSEKLTKKELIKYINERPYYKVIGTPLDMFEDDSRISFYDISMRTKDDELCGVITIYCNVYIMNDLGKTIDSISCC